MKMLIDGQWVSARQQIDVLNPYSGEVIDTVPAASADQVETAIASAVAGAKQMRDMPAYRRSGILHQAANLMRAQAEDLARLLSLEEGKILKEAQTEVSRAIETLQLSAEEAKRLTGETLPLDAVPGGEGRLGFTLRVPCGVVAAITPFNFPLNLPCHKVGPALAAGNAVILKPASDTPLVALRLAEILLEAGLPPQAFQCITGSGSQLGSQLCQDSRVRKISFTGSYEIGKKLTQQAGVKRLTLELGSNSPVLVLDDADLELAAQAIVATGYSNAGQVCISAQRVIATPKVYPQLIELLKNRVASLICGDPLEPETQMGPMIRPADAQRVGEVIAAALSQGAQLAVGTAPHDQVTSAKQSASSGHPLVEASAMYSPSLVVNASPEMRICREELFGPAVAVMQAKSVTQAFDWANDSRYGLSASVFTRDISLAMRFAREVDAGNLHINFGPAWRADSMPYGGLKDSGIGREGPKYAVEEMTELKTVVFHNLQ